MSHLSLCPSCYAGRCVCLTLVITPLLVTSALAAPTDSRELVRRDAGPAAVAIWIPILGAALAVSIITSTVIYLRRRSSPPSQIPTRTPVRATTSQPNLATRLRTWSSRPVIVPGVTPNPQTRELTAEQLAGGALPARSRRRRPGSTASTRSTRSLPLYMKEPGEQEVVVFRGQEDLGEDVNINVRTSVLLPRVDEGHERSSFELRRASVSSLTGPETPLLENHEQDPQQTLSPDPGATSARGIVVRPSMDTIGGGSSEAGEPLMNDNEHERERGPAPPYAEAVSIDSGVAFNESTEDGHSPSSPTDANAVGATMPVRSAPAQRHSIRRPGLFGRSESSAAPVSASALEHNGRLSHLLHLFNPVQRQNQTPAQNADSNDALTPPGSPTIPESPRPSSEHHGRRPRGATVAGLASQPSSPYRTHRPSNSSASALSAVFRTRSNTSFSGVGGTHSHSGLASPSMISLHSISAPLTHTVVRTEYTYPRTGPTAEQMKLIASVDSFKRFGVPYGPDAVAYAASASRLDLSQPPPPVFEEVVASGGDGREESGRRSGEGQVEAGGEGRGEGEGQVQGSAGSAGSSQMSSEQESSELASQSGANGATSEPQPVSNSELQAGPVAEETQEGEPESGAVSVSSQESSNDQTETGTSADSQAPVPPTPAPAPLTAEDVKRILRSNIPPSSFKDKAVTAPLSPLRPGSRASSHATFATAEDSFSLVSPESPDASSKSSTTVVDQAMLESTPDVDADKSVSVLASGSKDESSPTSTPRLSALPVHENTNDEIDTTTIDLPPRIEVTLIAV